MRINTCLFRPSFALRALLPCLACALALSGCGSPQPPISLPPKSSEAAETLARPFKEPASPVVEEKPLVVAAPPTPAAAPPPEPPRIARAAVLERVPACWQALAGRLLADGIDPDQLLPLFNALGPSVSQVPMGAKVNELYTAKYLRTPPGPGAPRPVAPAVYKGVVTKEHARLCQEFILGHAALFKRLEQRYGVPAPIGASLLFVETRLGTQVGKHSAVRNLASMAASTTPGHVPDYTGKLAGYSNERRDWLAGRVREKADWAYVELKALLLYAQGLERDLLDIPGSIYGAIGICQFMPSNIKSYAVDGDGDGRIDLHCVDDAVMSMGAYLSRHGWKRQMTQEQRKQILLRYNKSTLYVNTILELAKLVQPTLPVAGK